MFGFTKKVFVVAMTFFDSNPLNINSLECVAINNQECKTTMNLCSILSVLK